MITKDSLIGVKDSAILGSVVAYNFVEDVITIESEGKTYEFKKDAVVSYDKVGEVFGTTIYDGMVLQTSTGGHLYEIVGFEDGTARLDLLDNRTLTTKSVGEHFPIYQLATIIEEQLSIAGHSHTMLHNLPKVDFNIKTVRENNKEGITYFYACNDEKNEKVDLIKVIFMGHSLLKEEKYERATISHDDYLDAISKGTLKEVSPQEIANYVLGATYGQTKQASPSGDSISVTASVTVQNKVDADNCGFNCGCTEDCELEHDNEEEDYCERCEEYVSFCECPQCPDYCETCNEEEEDCECEDLFNF